MPSHTREHPQRKRHEDVSVDECAKWTQGEIVRLRRKRKEV